MAGDKSGKNKISWADIVLYTLLFYLFVESYLYGFRQINTSLTGDDRAIMSWVRQNTPGESRFLILTGRQGPEIDTFQEWFPALAAHQSITTIQGLEWLLGPKFFKRYGELKTLQTCENLDCIRSWSIRNNLEFEYILLLKKDAESNMYLALENDNEYETVYQTDKAQIYKNLSKDLAQ